MSLYAIFVAITILAVAVNLVCSWVVFVRLGRANASKSPGWWTPARVRAIESCKPGDTILLTTDQHLSATQLDSFREWSERFAGEYGVKLALLTGGINPAVVLRSTVEQKLDANEDELSPLGSVDRHRARLIDEIDARLSARIAARLRERRPDSDGHPPAHP